MTKGLWRTGVFANDKLAFEAVRRELVGLAIVEGHQPIGGEDTFTSEIVGSPTTKWTGRTILVVHDSGRFGVAYTSNTDLIWEPRAQNLDYLYDEEAYAQEELLEASDEVLRFRIKDLSEACSFSHRNAEYFRQRISEIRLELKKRERRSRTRAAA